jgi:hypothetical protein
MHQVIVVGDDCLLVVAHCSLAEVNRRFRGAYCLHHHLPDDGGSTPTRLPTTRLNIPADSHLYTRRRKSLKSRNFKSATCRKH